MAKFVRIHSCGAIILLVSVLNLNLVESQKGYQQKALEAHNLYRAKHGSPPLTLDNNLNKIAEACANYYASRHTIDHSCLQVGNSGENLFAGSGSYTPERAAEMATKLWYDEVKKYNFNRPGFTSGVGHFTQVVWKNSKRLGFGVATINGYTVGVGIYDPAGNYEGQFPQNVLPEGGGSGSVGIQGEQGGFPSNNLGEPFQNGFESPTFTMQGQGGAGEFSQGIPQSWFNHFAPLMNGQEGFGNDLNSPKSGTIRIRVMMPPSAQFHGGDAGWGGQNVHPSI